ncbi:hypothetical protein LLEC1_03522 [Akanthomyces lecanii]|uniref:Uncharacterized protein n=1 Tax=Cordyceps confragosa TaxID=2714763 RepID=A0A179IAI7_CORDF|nr:hypothetical protein LLEC1_03522 [Akanthomyces lecanii]
MATPPSDLNGGEEHLSNGDEVPRVNGHVDVNGDRPSGSQTPETPQLQVPDPSSPEALEKLQAFDWEDFESRYEAALLRASEEEKSILKEAESLSKAWAAAASSHDDARAVKRLQTRQRFVNLSEEKLSQKQQHYVEVVQAFESALALLKSTGFHDAHFSSAVLSSFQQEFVSPNPQAAPYDDENGEYCEEEDNLGYYEDGVKRTLTDEQIEIFRHSELRELERAKEKASKLHQSKHSSGEPGTASSQPNSTATNKPRDRKNGRKRSTKQGKREPKPDLRKRTWDVVEAGLDSLDYD